MKFIVLNGSPKGEKSLTLQYVKYLKKISKEHDFKVLHIASQINKIEKDEELFNGMIDDIKSCDGVLWAFPLYVFLVCSQYKRFIELIFERNVQEAFENKYAASLSTSIHFYDHTANNYIHAISEDLNMKFVDYYSADMYDLLDAGKRKKLACFFQLFTDAIHKNQDSIKKYKPVKPNRLMYKPQLEEKTIDTSHKKIIVVADLQEEEHNIKKMVNQFSHILNHNVEIINLNTLSIKGGCMGCLRCAYDNQCFYEGKDGFIDVYKEKLMTADILLFAGAIKDRYLSARWKMFFDRGFFNTHTPSLIGKQIGFIISGSLQQIPDLQEILQAYVEWQGSNLCGIVTDEYEDSSEVDRALYHLASQSMYYAKKAYIRSSTFLGIGGMKIFRDDMWGRLRFPFIADHKYYKENGIYNDFPQKDYPSRFKNGFLSLMAKIPTIRDEIYKKRIKDEMIKPFQKFIDNINA
ncbi:NAD(P)H-dependent oxidoreductase [Vallitalea pronyensis]|uniref:NAD(P)H-dependent oxidoreductase n=1 Tax=Vallitalea pronyensis TaxID=1348613 RepID=A0A8J8MGI4_9FIRM|nr:NAD(P)H-dependent oxidoreductase [Vallitalea pronyensis]QUI21046.1 NAD(P)H-dependent oxidoreductase [Vallitalea pronyensis]